MKIHYLISLLALAILLPNCGTKNKEIAEGTGIKEYKVHYAQGFSVSKQDAYTKITVTNPWNSTAILQTYILVDKDKALPPNLPQGKVIRTPIANVVAYSTIHASTLKELAAINIVTGVCEPEYMDIVEIKEGVKQGTIKNFGMAKSPDIEQILLLSPEAILASPIVGHSYGNVEKIGITIIETPDYMEPLPLGRAEWIRFYSLFVGKEQLADSLFFAIEKEYNTIKELAKTGTNNPKILTDQRYQGTWNMAGGKSYMANMLADAGGNYMWAANDATELLQLSFETVLDQGGDADVWLLRYYADKDMTYRSLKAEYNAYSYFGAYKNRTIWGCNTANTSYYEDLPIHPEYILKDFAAIFNPTLFAGYTPKYFSILEE